ncbi:MAG TPA: hypothetical protein PK055_08030 [Gammaproteobacteria bacterium]|nr:hypothetical protein [Xanthomonadales bacterium]MCB1595727.1 hypothetical protein [Xanthomonadales bacterium]HPI95732.1 hypothetical protein [Gammaproteobacteria bacterium]HPQ87591.1 hypothetical protein [Gammaproteobacteria bacterium]
MATKSNNTIIYIITIAAVLFIVAFAATDFFRVDNSEIVNVEVVKLNNKPKNTPKPIIQDTYDIKSPQNNEDTDSIQEATPQEIKEATLNSVRFRNYMSSLRTPEEIVAAISRYQSKGETDKVALLKERLNYVFPEYRY